MCENETSEGIDTLLYTHLPATLIDFRISFYFYEIILITNCNYKKVLYSKYSNKLNHTNKNNNSEPTKKILLLYWLPFYIYIYIASLKAIYNWFGYIYDNNNHLICMFWITETSKLQVNFVILEILMLLFCIPSGYN